MRKLFVAFICAVLVVACNRDRAVENTLGTDTAAETAPPPATETTATVSGTSDTGTPAVTPAETSSTDVSTTRQE